MHKVVVGVTGGLASGKSTVARFLKVRQAELIDADKIAHSMLKPGTEIYRKLLKAFGNKILGPGARIERRKLAGIAFSDKKALKKLNAVVHPPLIKEIKKRISSCARPFIILDAPLLIEAGLLKLVHKLVVVKTGRQEQLRRARKNLKLEARQASRRLKGQIPQSARERLADFIIDNSGTLEQTKKQAAEIRRKLWKS